MADTDHQWLILATYEFSEDELTKAMMDSSTVVGLSHQRLASIEGPGCFKCEAIWPEGKGRPCTEPDSSRLPKDKLTHPQEFRREH